MELVAVVVLESRRTGSDRERERCFDAHVANRPIAHHVIDQLEGVGVRDVVVACPAEHAEYARTCFESRKGRLGTLTYADQEGPLDVIGALQLAGPAVGRAPCIVHGASGLLDQPLAPFVEMVRRAPSDVTVIAQRSRANEDTPDRIAIGVFGQAVLSNVAAAWPPHCRLDISTLADRVATDGGKLRLHRTDAWWSYDGDPLDLLELNRIALGRLRASNRGRAHDENRIEGPVLVDECASVSDSVIVGPAAIGARARINHAYIGPYTSVGAGARIEGAEVERSIIASGASITHVRGRIVASVVGQNARVFHDFSLPRALRLRVGAGTEVALY